MKCSMGGPFALAFAGLYPEHTAGVVLVDSMHPDQSERLPARIGRDPLFATLPGCSTSGSPPDNACRRSSKRN